MSDRGAKPKLLYLVSEDWYFVSHRLPLAAAAREAGYDVVVATRTAAHAEQIRDAGLRLIPISFERSGLGPLGEARTLAGLLSLYRQEKPDLVHHVALKPVIYGAMAARAAGVRNVVSALMGLGYVFSSDDPKARVLRPFVRAALGAALKGKRSRVIVQNRDDFEGFIANGLAEATSVRLIRGSGVEPSRYALAQPGGGASGPLVVLPARMLRDKGVFEFAEAARLLKARGVAARFALVGEPDPLNPASLTAAEIDAIVAQGAVEYWGWRKDMGAVFESAQIACLPSYREGLPKALLEAAASGLPIVTTDVPGCREIVRAGKNGWLVPARDAGALADALGEAIGNAELRVRYGTAGRRMVEEEFSLARIVAETLDVYRELTGTGAAGAPA
jgi:glycosyltransferase involved in cell wall biosynthesis